MGGIDAIAKVMPDDTDWFVFRALDNKLSDILERIEPSNTGLDIGSIGDDPVPDLDEFEEPDEVIDIYYNVEYNAPDKRPLGVDVESAHSDLRGDVSYMFADPAMNAAAEKLFWDEWAESGTLYNAIDDHIAQIYYEGIIPHVSEEDLQRGLRELGVEDG